MKNFVETARDKAMAPGATEDASVEAWAVRAFSVISVLGGMDCIEEKAGESLSSLLAKAPTEVVAGGTMAVMLASMKASETPNISDIL